MEKPRTYCEYVKHLDGSDLHRIYHDTQYGFPLDDDNELFGRLVLEINQAGLSWTTILAKQENFRKAYSGFDVSTVAGYKEQEIARLLSDTGIIRNRLKVNSAIYNARQVVDIQQRYGSFKNWLDDNHPLKVEEWIGLFKKVFKFTGGEITREFLISTGYLKGAHEQRCPIYAKVFREHPIWSITKSRMS